MDDHSNPLTVEIIYLAPNIQTQITLNLPEDTSILEAISNSGILEKHTEIDLQKNKVGIFGQMMELTTTVKHGDRIEIYRPLLLDPKEKRFLQVKKNKTINR